MGSLARARAHFMHSGKKWWPVIRVKWTTHGLISLGFFESRFFLLLFLCSFFSPFCCPLLTTASDAELRHSISFVFRVAIYQAERWQFRAFLANNKKVFCFNKLSVPTTRTHEFFSPEIQLFMTNIKFLANKSWITIFSYSIYQFPPIPMKNMQ